MTTHYAAELLQHVYRDGAPAIVKANRHEAAAHGLREAPCEFAEPRGIHEVFCQRLHTQALTEFPQCILKCPPPCVGIASQRLQIPFHGRAPDFPLLNIQR